MFSETLTIELWGNPAEGYNETDLFMMAILMDSIERGYVAFGEEVVNVKALNNVQLKSILYLPLRYK